MKTFAADLHIHSALSACADAEMTPPGIVLAALAANLDLIAVCDHNSAANVAAVQEAAGTVGEGYLGVIAAIEITTAEEAHLLGYFPSAEKAMAVGRVVEESLPRVYPLGKHGRSRRENAEGGGIEEAPRVYSFAAALALNDAVALIREHGGLAVPAHVDRPSFSVISQLGMFPENLSFDAVEISAAGAHAPYGPWINMPECPVITSSDAHFFSAVGSARTLFRMRAPTFDEVAAALAKRGGRDCHIA